MRTVERPRKFKADYKREVRSDPSIEKLLGQVLEHLLADQPLPERYRDHALGGQWKGYRDCHLKPDLVLIYAKTEQVLALARLGSHSELFG